MLILSLEIVLELLKINYHRWCLLNKRSEMCMTLIRRWSSECTCFESHSFFFLLRLLCGLYTLVFFNEGQCTYTISMLDYLNRFNIDRAYHLSSFKIQIYFQDIDIKSVYDNENIWVLLIKKKNLDNVFDIRFPFRFIMINSIIYKWLLTDRCH